MVRESTEIWNDAARSLEFQRNFEAAAECYNLSKKFGDDSVETLLNLAVSHIRLYEIYRKDHFLTLARDYLLSAIEKEPNEARLHHYLGIVSLSLGEKEAAVREFFVESELSAEEESELAWSFELAAVAPPFYLPEEDVYELLPDPVLFKIFDLVKDFPLDSAFIANLKDIYGERSTDSLLALYLRSIYYKVFEDRKFAAQLGLISTQAKWEAVLIFFVRGINEESKDMVSSALSGNSIDLSKLPAYTRLLINRYRREILSSSSNVERFKALLLLPMKKLQALNSACELASKPESGEKLAFAVLAVLEKIGLARRKGERYSIAEPLLEGFDERARLESKLSKGEYDQEFFALFRNLLAAKRFEYALALAKKVRALYEPAEATAYIKEILSRIKLGEEEMYSILSEI